MDRSSCEETASSENAPISKKQWILLYAAAALILFFRLGTADINGSEGRWLAVADEMLRSGDWFHPTINAQPYFDKPLLSYWFIALLSKLVGGVSEWTGRIPSALAALLTLTAVVSIAKRLFSPTAALATGWALTATYSFVYWGRLAEADMWNAAFIVAATAWYLRFREKRSFVGYAVFWGLCAAGAQTKGLAAAIIPAMAAGTDMLLNRRLKLHCNLKSWLGLLCGILLYSAPFLLETIFRNDYEASGIALVFKENIVRAVNPWDHNKEPFWCYFIYLPQLLLPLTPVFLLALFAGIRRVVRKIADNDEKWLLLQIALIFLLFSCSRSRRVYYILPAVPFCAILCGKFLSEVGESWEYRVNRFLFRAVDLLLPILAVPLIFLPLYLGKLLPLDLPVALRREVGFTVAGAALAVILLWILLKRSCRTEKFFPAAPETMRVFCMIYLALLTVFALILPCFQADPEFRSGRTFFTESGKPMAAVPHRMFFGGDYSYAVFYLHLAEPAQVAATRDVEKLRTFLALIDREGGAVFGRWDKISTLPEDLRRRFIKDDGLTPADGVSVESLNRIETSRLSRARHPERRRAKLLAKKHLLLVVPPRNPR